MTRRPAHLVGRSARNPATRANRLTMALTTGIRTIAVVQAIVTHLGRGRTVARSEVALA